MYANFHFWVNNQYLTYAASIAAGIAATAYGILLLIRKAEFRKRGVWVEGEVSAIIEEAGGDGNPLYYPKITYVTLDNRAITRSYNLIKSRPCNYVLNEKVTIIYDPLDNAEFIIDNKSNNFLPWALIVFGLSFLI